MTYKLFLVLEKMHFFGRLKIAVHDQNFQMVSKKKFILKEFFLKCTWNLC